MGCLLKGGGGLYSRLVVGAVVQAGGPQASQAGRPTCLLELGGVALIRRLLIALSGAGVDEVVVVLGRHAELIEPALQDFPITVVRNPDPDDGADAAVRAGLAALGGKLDAVLVAPAAQPMVNAQDLGQLIGAYKKRPAGALMVAPQVDGEAGNPVIVSAEVREQLLAADAPTAWRDWPAAHADQVSAFVTPIRRYRVGIDTPQDLARFEALTGHRLVWPAALQPVGVDG